MTISIPPPPRRWQVMMVVVMITWWSSSAGAAVLCAAHRRQMMTDEKYHLVSALLICLPVMMTFGVLAVFTCSGCCVFGVLSSRVSPFYCFFSLAQWLEDLVFVCLFDSTLFLQENKKVIVLSLSLLSSFCTATINDKRRGDDDQEDFSSFFP